MLLIFNKIFCRRSQPQPPPLALFGVSHNLEEVVVVVVVVEDGEVVVVEMIVPYAAMRISTLSSGRATATHMYSKVKK